jgi:ComF family protein
VAAGLYEHALRGMIHGLKFHRRWYLAQPLAELLAEVVRREVEELPAYVVPMPLVLLRRLGRGYNQADLIGAELARRLQLRYVPGVLRRQGWRAVPQMRLPRHRRARNVRSAFRARRRLPAGASVLLVDDVVTTGSTAAAAATVLRDEIGAGRVVVAAAARVTRGRGRSSRGRPA